MMQSVLLPNVCALLVPHSARPVWHDWGANAAANSSAEPNNNKAAASQTARRRLFREEEDETTGESNQQFVRRLLSELEERYTHKWGFDFGRGRPLADSNAGFVYEQVAAESVPGFYRMVTLASPTSSSQHNASDAENQGSGGSPPTSAEEPNNENNAVVEEDGKCSPGRVLKKARRSTHTPKRGYHEHQSKVTEFLCTRKHHLTRSASKAQLDAEEEEHQATEGTPRKRARQTALLEADGARKSGTPRRHRAAQRRSSIAQAL